MYDEKYYKKHETGSNKSALIILRYIQTFLPVHTIVDLGCGIGTWGSAANSLGISQYLGIDQNSYEDQPMLIPDDQYFQHNLQIPLHLNHKYDIAISVEVAEHIDAQYAETLISDLCCYSKIVLFSAAIPEQGGRGHINEQPCSYWIDLFNKNNYIAVDCIRPYCWDNMDIEVWYKNNCMLYIEKEEYESLKSHIPSLVFPADIVHPQMLKRILRKRGV